MIGTPNAGSLDSIGWLRNKSDFCVVFHVAAWKATICAKHSMLNDKNWPKSPETASPLWEKFEEGE